MTYTQRKFQAGFSVVELMIAMLLSMALAGGIISVFVNNSYSFQQDENIGRMQDDARHALREIAFDLSMAGHYADLHIPGTVSYDGGLAIGQDCGPAGEANWMYRAVEAGTGNSLSLTAIDNATNASVSNFQSASPNNAPIPTSSSPASTSARYGPRAPASTACVGSPPGSASTRSTACVFASPEPWPSSTRRWRA